MSWFPRPVGPIAAFRDLAAFSRQRSREQRIGAALALLSTAIIVVVFFADAKVNTETPAQIVYVEQWRADRSDAEIVKAQKERQAAREAAVKERQRQFKKLEKQLGME